MTKTLQTLLVSAALITVSGASYAASVAKKPDPSSIHFIDAAHDADAALTANVVGHLFFHRADGTINVEYLPADAPNPTATKIVMLCTDNAARVEFPISENYSGPVAACGSLRNLKFTAE